MKKFIILIIVMTLFASCSTITNTTATLREVPDDRAWVYTGPKDVAMSVESEGKKVSYDGKTEGFWEGILKYLLTKPDITIER